MAHRRKRKLRKGSKAWLKRQNRNAFRRAAAYGRIIEAAKRRRRSRRIPVKIGPGTIVMMTKKSYAAYKRRMRARRRLPASWR